MTRTLQQWKVLPHGKLTEVDENILRSELESLKRILVSHGSPIEDHPGKALRDLAGSLA